MERYPISVRLIGVMHKEKSKMYMISVLWSDQSDIVVYRTFMEFKKMHKQMKKLFPSGSKLRKSDRTIPSFRDKKMKQSNTRKGPTKSMVRLKFLQKYCNELLSCDPRVSQSAELVKFFQPKDEELQPEFSKNSIMIMHSDNDGVTGGGGHGTGGNVTQPFVTETYRCVAQYETKDTKNKPFKVAVDEKVDVLIKDKAGWWLVENEEKRMAWFPAPYLEKVDDDDDDDEDETGGTCGRGMLYTAIKNYKAAKDDEITVSIGSVVELMQMSENGWWLIRYKGKVGYIPAMFLQPYRYPQIHMTPHQPDSRSFSPLLGPPSSLEHQSQLSRSQGNLLQLPPVRSSSPLPITPDSKQKSRSVNFLPQQPPAQPSPNTSASSASNPPQPAPPPTIKVELDGDEEEKQGGRSPREDADTSFTSECSDFSFSDDFSSSSESSSLNLSSGTNDQRLRLSRTPPPTPSNHLSPMSGLEGKLMPSVSDPNLYKGPASPKVPPRPRAQEILTRCTTVTRKNAARGSQTPTQTEIISR